MKTTIDIADSLLVHAKTRARREKKTLKAIVEDALRSFLARSAAPRTRSWRPRAFRGKGTQDGIREGDWETIRELIYRA
jgi:Arc/MetJ family transcription regulator